MSSERPHGRWLAPFGFVGGVRAGGRLLGPEWGRLRAGVLRTGVDGCGCALRQSQRWWWWLPLTSRSVIGGRSGRSPASPRPLSCSIAQESKDAGSRRDRPEGKRGKKAAAGDTGDGVAEDAEGAPYRHTVNLPVTSFDQRANAVVREPQIQQFWAEHRVFERLAASRLAEATFVLHDGPPYANGALHIGHALNKILKDIINRYQILRGKRVHFLPGWDCHGLPIELRALQSLSKKEKASLTPMLIRQVAERFALDAVQEQRASFQRYGVWAAWERPYLTLDPAYEAAQIQVFGEMFLKGFIYRGRKPVHWSPSSRTALAEAELEYPEGHVSRSLYAAFEVVQPSERARALLQGRSASVAVWTTTPWTIPANRAVAVNPALEYQVVEAAMPQRRVLIVATSLVETLSAKWGTVLRLLGTLRGADLIGTTYRHPLYPQLILRVVLGGDYVTTDAGTGLVHTAPGHGTEDFAVGQRESLEVFSPVDDAGRFTAEAGEALAGLSVLGEGNAKVIAELQACGALLLEEPYEHKYPYDWRTKKPTIFRATDQWFASIEPFRQQALRAVAQVQWIPPAGAARMRGMIESRSEWCISRQRAWGVPIPVFFDEATGEPVVDADILQHVQSVFAQHGSSAWWTLSVDDLLPPHSPHRGRALRRGTDTMDVWFDSGTSWAAALRDASASEGEAAPKVDLYLEGSDQHRGWFQSSLLTSVATRGTAPYRAVLTHGFVLDEKGMKMSKSVGNVVDPMEIIVGGADAKKKPPYGADVLRLWVSSVDYSSDVLIGPTILRQVADIYRKLRNTLRYMAGNLYDFEAGAVAYADLPSLDRYMLRRASQVMRQVQEAYDEYAFYRVFQTLQRFAVVDLSNFYLDIAKDRCYVAVPSEPRRRSCQLVMHAVVRDMARALAPILPHTAEDLWQSLRRGGGDAEAGAGSSIFEHGWLQHVTQAPGDASEDAVWDTVRGVRDVVNKALEGARSAGEIGASLEAHVVIRPGSAAVAECLRQCDRGNGVDELRYLFIVSQVTLEPALPEKVPLAAALEATEVSVRRADGHKCVRCWNYSVRVGEHATHPRLCERCVESVQRLGA
ncbi:hypothetical protein CDCA_CDCA12G3399 [Cyanidium caldarium]|uniref:isoleucine--tRNA ligase n=1 Tax=Cyanidium caldarium TaxID=2771 RepID=A0AAV9IYQ2_CYACA|nr:hypothetical protein CDCA_CDCA12G3399 [Cyanidium caldarium]